MKPKQIHVHFIAGFLGRRDVTQCLIKLYIPEQKVVDANVA